MAVRHSERLVPLAFIAALMLVSPAAAVIEAALKIGNVINDSDAIYMTKVERIDAEKEQAVFVVQDELQGKPIARKLMVNLKTGKPTDIPLLVKRLAPDLPVLMFESKQKDKMQVLAFTNGTWFQLTTPVQNPWGFVGCEPVLRRTFKGTTSELRTLVEDVKSGKQKPPAPNLKEAPGLGPEVAESPK